LFDDKKDQAHQALLVIEAQLSADLIRDAKNSAKSFTAAKAPLVFNKNKYDDEFLTRKSSEEPTPPITAPDPSDKSEAQSEAQQLYQAAMIRWQRRSNGVDETEAKELFRQAAERGHPEAQMVMGEITENFGLADTAAQREAFLWFSKAAVQGLPEAQYRVGECHYFGTGTPRNLERAASWYLTAANADNPHAQDAIAGLFEYGEGVAEDPIKAREWSLKATTRGIHRSVIRLATIYERGAGVAQDFVEAYRWYIVADLIKAKIDTQRKVAGLLPQTTVSGRGDTLGKDTIRNTISLDDVSGAKKRALEFFEQIVAFAEIPRFSRRQNDGSSLSSPPITSRFVPYLEGREINGTIFHNELEKSSGHGKLTVVNGLANDAIIKLTIESKEVTRFYVRFSHSFTLEGIPDGKYTLMFCSGDKWNPEHHMFTENLSAQKYSDPLHFVTKFESSVSGRTIVSDVVTITLHKVADGNVRSESISPSEFQTEDSTQE
jgi:TPR repeat protein